MISSSATTTIITHFDLLFAAFGYGCLFTRHNQEAVAFFAFTGLLCWIIAFTIDIAQIQ